MTPFGLKLKQLRSQKGMTQKEMAEKIGVSAAYLSALEHGKRGTPRWMLVQRIVECLNIIWDDADELQALALQSHPKVTIDTSDLSVEATELANLLAANIDTMSKAEIDTLIVQVKSGLRNNSTQPKYLPRE